jgi:deazaflavin-dependent oxidoreductase (nitroreductase family)
MSTQSPRTNPWFWLTHRIAMSRPGVWLFSPIIHHLDRLILRLTDDRWSFFSLVTGLPVMTVAMTGAKSGQPRPVPLVGIPDGDKIVLIASNFGRPHHPAWYFNLRAHPEVEATSGTRTSAFVARETDGDEREKYWAEAVRWYAGYAVYQQRAAHRKIPVMVLEPKVNG